MDNSENEGNNQIRVFISSTKVDLEPHRKKVIQAINELPCDPVIMENFGSRTESPLITSLSELENSNIYLGILGMRYGSYGNPDEKISITELEYHKAIELKQEILFYLIDEENALIKPKFVDIGEKGLKLEKFKNNLKDKHTVSFYKSEEDLYIQVKRDLQRELYDKYQLIEPITKTIKHEIIESFITLAVPGTGTYYLGDKLFLSGTSHSKNVFLFLTGESINENGVKLDDPNVICETGTDFSFTKVPVDEEGIWEFEWDTKNINQNSSIEKYTIYAATKPSNRRDIKEKEFYSEDIQIKLSNLNVIVNPSVLAQGDLLTISGSVNGKIDHVFIWIFGDIWHSLWNYVPVNDDGLFEYMLQGKDTTNIPSGQYFIVIQVPISSVEGFCRSEIQGISANTIMTNPEMGYNIEHKRLDNKGGYEKASILLDCLNDKRSRDIYSKLTFMVEAPYIHIKEIGKIRIGDTIYIDANTNLSKNNEIIVKLQPISEIVTKLDMRIKEMLLNMYSGTTFVQKEDSINKIYYEIKTLSLPPGSYEISLSTLNGKVTSSINVSLSY